MIPVLVSDLRTPSFLIDMDILSKVCGSDHVALYLPKYDVTLYPQSMQNSNIHKDYDDLAVYDISSFDLHMKKHQHALGYCHSSVTRDRNDYEVDNSPTLAEIDLSPSLCVAPGDEYTLLNNGAILVLGINNHHVGSYYWARSTGMGASMEAPGILFDCQDIKYPCMRGILRWEEEGGPTKCNSNDGKRSEWVNFLKVGDQVQLIPMCNEDAMMSFVENCSSLGTDLQIYGFTMRNRPLGSEPLVKCRYTTQR
jgi:hypothetical protein